MGGLTILLLTGVLSVPHAFAEFSNEDMLTVAALYIIVAGLRDTGGRMQGSVVKGDLAQSMEFFTLTCTCPAVSGSSTICGSAFR